MLVAVVFWLCLFAFCWSRRRALPSVKGYSVLLLAPVLLILLFALVLPPPDSNLQLYGNRRALPIASSYPSVSTNFWLSQFTPESLQASRNAMLDLEKEIHETESNSEPATFHNTILPLDGNLRRITTHRDFMEAYELLRPETFQRDKKKSEPNTKGSIWYHPKLYARVREALDSIPKNGTEYSMALAFEAFLRDHDFAFNEEDRQIRERTDSYLTEQLGYFKSQTNVIDKVDTLRAMMRLLNRKMQLVQSIASDTFEPHFSYVYPTHDWADWSSSIATMADAEASFQTTWRMLDYTGVVSLRQKLKSINESMLSVFDKLPHFNISSVLHNGVFFMIEELYGLRCLRRHDLESFASKPNLTAVEIIDGDSRSLGLIFLELVEPGFLKDPADIRSLTFRTRGPTEFYADAHIRLEVESAEHFTIEECRNVFHEFGHALHYMFDRSPHEILSTRNCAIDVMESVSQLHELWFLDPVVLRHIDPSLSGSDIRYIQNYAQVLQVDQSIRLSLDTVEALLWYRMSRDLRNFDRNLRNMLKGLFIGSEWLRIDGWKPSVEFFMSLQSPVHPLSYLQSLRLATSAQEWAKANGGLSRSVGDRFRNDIMSKGCSIRFRDMAKLFDGYQNVRVYENITAILQSLGDNVYKNLTAVANNIRRTSNQDSAVIFQNINDD